MILLRKFPSVGERISKYADVSLWEKFCKLQATPGGWGEIHNTNDFTSHGFSTGFSPCGSTVPLRGSASMASALLLIDSMPPEAFNKLRLHSHEEIPRGLQKGYAGESGCSHDPTLTISLHNPRISREKEEVYNEVATSQYPAQWLVLLLPTDAAGGQNMSIFVIFSPSDESCGSSVGVFSMHSVPLRTLPITPRSQRRNVCERDAGMQSYSLNISPVLQGIFLPCRRNSIESH